VRISLRGTKEECQEIAERIGTVLRVVDVSQPYPDRRPGSGLSELHRVYVEVRLDTPKADAPSTDSE
jgi:hypothetical protein